MQALTELTSTSASEPILDEPQWNFIKTILMEYIMMKYNQQKVNNIPPTSLIPTLSNTPPKLQPIPYLWLFCLKLIKQALSITYLETGLNPLIWGSIFVVVRSNWSRWNWLTLATNIGASHSSTSSLRPLSLHVKRYVNRYHVPMQCKYIIKKTTLKGLSYNALPQSPSYWVYQ